MRVLLNNCGALHCMEVVTAAVSAEDDELILENEQSYVTVSGIVRANAEAAVRTLFLEGRADLTMYQSDI